jgi:hypothetical protein
MAEGTLHAGYLTCGFIIWQQSEKSPGQIVIMTIFEGNPATDLGWLNAQKVVGGTPEIVDKVRQLRQRWFAAPVHQLGASEPGQ